MEPPAARKETGQTPDVFDAPRQRATPGLYAELHLHLGGAILPHILYVRLQRDGHPLLKKFDSYAKFERFFTRRRHDLRDYLKMHELVEKIQQPADPTLYYFVTRLVRGAFLFENLAYMELRHTPYNRTDAHLPPNQRIEQMRAVVEVVAAAAGRKPSTRSSSARSCACTACSPTR